MLRKFWKERPPTPVILAWMTAGALTLLVLGWSAYGLIRLVCYLAS